MKIHHPKLSMQSDNGDFHGLRSYLLWLEKNSPDKYFEGGQRSSTLKKDPQVKPHVFYNKACEMTNIALKTARNNRERHSIVEDFFLINDLSTVAVEIPVWYWDKKEGEGISGHIDILQIRNNRLYILDYKPDAKKQKHAPAQINSYARAISYRAKIPLDQIYCAYFDEKNYYEFSPVDIS